MVWWQSLLRCPACRDGALVGVGESKGAVCESCGVTFSRTESRVLDLRRGRDAMLVGETEGPGRPSLAGIRVGRPERSFEGASSWRAPAELLSALTSAVPRGGALLDAGCGAGDFRKPVSESLGLQYVGLDIDADGADLLADLHNIPFANGSFDAVVSFAVVSCCRRPAVVLAEFARVMKPGGVLVATFGFLEPYVGDSHRLTHAGLVDLLNSTGFRTERIWACRDALEALSSYIGPYPAVVKRLLRALARAAGWDFLSPRRWLRETPEQRAERTLWTAGSLGIVARLAGSFPEIARAENP